MTLPSGSGYTMTRDQFESLNADLFEETLIPVKQALTDANLTACDIDKVVLVGGSSRIPKIRSLLEDMFGVDKVCADLHPDEAVSIGAAIQAGIIQQQVPTVLMDIVTQSKGIATQRDNMSVLIPRGTVLPTHVSQVFTTVTDNQDKVTIRIYEGEEILASHNSLLGEFELRGIAPSAPKGVPQIAVRFYVDVNGILTVSATDAGTGHSEAIVVELTGL